MISFFAPVGGVEEGARGRPRSILDGSDAAGVSNRTSVTNPRTPSAPVKAISRRRLILRLSGHARIHRLNGDGMASGQPRRPSKGVNLMKRQMINSCLSVGLLTPWPTVTVVTVTKGQRIRASERCAATPPPDPCKWNGTYHRRQHIPAGEAVWLTRAWCARCHARLARPTTPLARASSAG